MSDPGRKSLPHDPPLWIDPSREIYFLTVCARDRSGHPLILIASQLLDSIRYFHDCRKWSVRIALVMPDHVHFLASCPENFTGTVRAWKHWTTHNLGVIW